MGQPLSPLVGALALALAAALVGLAWQAGGAGAVAVAMPRVEPSAMRGRPSCAYERAHGLFIGLCSEMELTEVPILRSDITALELTRNRIREVPQDAFERTPKLRVLYLGDNMIAEDVAYALAPLSNLEILDLSLNNLRTIPPEILQLPSLRKLYLSRNRLNAMAPDFRISSPTLQLLWLSDCKLRSLSLGDLPQLLNLNVSANPNLPQLRMSEVARLCRLQTLDASGTSDALPPGEDPLDACRCPIENMWRSLRQQISMSKRSCDDWIEDGSCGLNSTEVAEAAFDMNADCVEAAMRELQASTRTWWAVIGGSLIASLALAIAVLAWRGRRDKKVPVRRDVHVRPPLPELGIGVKEAAPLAK